ncbi:MULTISPECIES: tRNA lysidine(34) synthetase TilS [Kocuria]|mgnify:CR=1 FL=1|uniref:tRNA lysidine(34) synthetase TilS n=1 Tax=Kocuria TaxID=57493 RepID=UPI001EE7CD08|nr:MULTISPECIES: tRNA lysidine(34) synthetase TilS [Kocuria]
MQRGRTGRLHPWVARARRAVGRAIEELPARHDGRLPLVLIACSGGPDSLALAAATAHFARRGKLRVGAAIIDHQMQSGSADVTESTARVLEDMGLEPVISRRVTVDRAGHGPEMAARLARYDALNDIARQTGADAVLLGHTRNDQAETVLLGLARGSGTRSLSGMSPRHTIDGVQYRRPFLNVTREETEEICRAEGLDPWHDPSNSDTTLMRSKVRHEVLPWLEDHLGPGVSNALARTASVLNADADFLDEQAAEFFRRARLDPAASSSENLELDGGAVQAAPAAMRRRMLAQACVAAGGETPTFERLSALEQFAMGYGAAGPLQMAGKVTVWRRRADKHCAKGRLEFHGTA